MSLIIDIKKRFGDFTLDVQLESTGVTGLLGASGCGKSVTLKCVAGILRPDAGEISLDGETLFSSARRIDLAPAKRRVGLLFQSYALFPNMTVEGNLLAGLSGLTKAARNKRVDELIAAFRLTEVRFLYPNQLSGGQQQRAALARMLGPKPRCLLLDEPFAAVDSFLKWQLETELADLLASFQGPSLFVSHDRGEVYRLSKNACVMEAGHARGVTETKSLFAHPHTHAAALLSGCRNFSAAVRRGAHTLLASDWGIALRCTKEVSPAVTRVGIFSQHLRLTPREGDNAIPARFLSRTEDVSCDLLVFSLVGSLALMQIEVPKGTPADGDALYVSPEDVLLLT